MCELTLPYPDLEKPKCALDIKIRFMLLVISLSMKNGVLFPLPHPFFSAVPWVSGTPLLLLACKPALTALQPSLLPSSVSEGQPSLVAIATSCLHAAMYHGTGHPSVVENVGSI